MYMYSSLWYAWFIEHQLLSTVVYCILCSLLVGCEYKVRIHVH